MQCPAQSSAAAGRPWGTWIARSPASRIPGCVKSRCSSTTESSPPLRPTSTARDASSTRGIATASASVEPAGRASLMPRWCHVAATAGLAGRARTGIWPVRGRSRRRLLGFDADTADATGGQVGDEGLAHAADEAEDAQPKYKKRPFGKGGGKKGRSRG